MGALDEAAETARYEAETETNELFVSARWAAFDAADAAIDQALQDNEDDQRLVDEYEYNIRQVRNSFRITKAKLVAERTNAELMVAIKQEMNFGEDIDMIDLRKDAIRDRLLTEEDFDKMDELDLEWDELSEQLEYSVHERARLQNEIQDLTARVTEMDAVALTITAVIDNEEAQIALDQQADREWTTQLNLMSLQTEISGYEMQLAFTFDDLQIANYTSILEGLYPQRDAYDALILEQENQRADILNALEASEIALDISNDLALGTTDAYERVLLSAADAAANATDDLALATEKRDGIQATINEK
jgi:hypothetical protein